ncbi:MgtC/SapB family protein [Paenibacillus harenae]|uniref:Mg2+ transporter-C (MgtC) family protein n=1 Tax=Paenibacillus harenae TaxID=306543 RepID=A0ABT9U7T3_PAEHA|nr:MgtC/SapB family protein [Paenibacillus harenae]MDQ0063639.1 putative Mg2+ transporter-C (MgtC) family protein [Paenibacillus harenae]MDQ0115623.1 putative Mg2+ transporter-C (MgtC) family protein [Paenibacillus harenae]
MNPLDNPWYISELHIFLRLMLALLLGGLIGLEREQSKHAAGLRTNILVCLGSCLLMMLSIYGFSAFVDEPNVRVDPARLAAAVITGVGFLGAGTILFTGKSITGLTTAASLWVVSAIGLAVGAGFYFASSVTTVMVLLTLWAFNKLEKRYIRAKKEQLLKIEATDQAEILRSINTLLSDKQIVIRKMLLQEGEDDHDTGRIVLHFHILIPKSEPLFALLEHIKHLEGVHWVSSE